MFCDENSRTFYIYFAFESEDIFLNAISFFSGIPDGRQLNIDFNAVHFVNVPRQRDVGSSRNY